MIVRLGTSGWSYPGWRLKFYPRGLASKDWLDHYARYFTTVEVNMTFYRFPRPETLRVWLERTPASFTFSLKANRQITHIRKLRQAGHDVGFFYRLADSLEGKLGCILYQLPPSLIKDLDLLKEFLAVLSPSYKNVIEFRDQSWYDENVYDLLRRAGVGFCTVSSKKVPATAIVTAPFAYFRFHGLTGGYRYNYTDDELTEWAKTIRAVKAEERLVYFNNDYQAYAVKNCLKLQELLGPA